MWRLGDRRMIRSNLLCLGRNKPVVLGRSTSSRTQLLIEDEGMSEPAEGGWHAFYGCDGLNRAFTSWATHPPRAMACLEGSLMPRFTTSMARRVGV